MSEEMDPELKKMLDRVKAILALAEDPGATEAEAELATARAAEIMAKWNIDKVMLAAEADKSETPSYKTIRFPDPYAMQHMYLYVDILRAFGGDAVILESPRRGYENNGYLVQAYGFKADLMAVDVLYTSLYHQGVTRCKNVPRYEHARTWRVSFWAGFTKSISMRLKEAHKSAETSSKTPGTALVLRDRKDAVQLRKFQDHGKLRTHGRPTARSADGYDTGREAGDHANLHNQKAMGTRRLALTT